MQSAKKGKAITEKKEKEKTFVRLLIESSSLEREKSRNKSKGKVVFIALWANVVFKSSFIA